MLAYSRSKASIRRCCRIGSLRPRSSYYVTASPNRLNLAEKQQQQEQQQREEKPSISTLSFKDFIEQKVNLHKKSFFFLIF